MTVETSDYIYSADQPYFGDDEQLGS